MKFTDWMNANRHPDNEWLCKRINCNDGFSVSVQASEYAYSTPRYTCHDYNIYSDFELGFPSDEDSLIMKYAEDSDFPTGTVYGYVPKGVVEKLIEKHGGIANDDRQEPSRSD